MKILVALDGSDAAFNALKSSCRIAHKMRSYVTAFYVNKGEEYSPEVTGWTSIKERISRELEIFGHEVIQKAYEIGRMIDVPVEGVVSEGIPAQEIYKYVNAHGIIKLVTTGHTSKGRGAQEFVESTTKTVVSQSKVPVFVTSRDSEIRRILIAVDDSDVSKRVTAFGGGLAKSLNAELGVISFIPDAEATINEYTRIAEVPNIEKYIEASEKGLKELVARTMSSTRNILISMDVKAPEIIKKGRPAEEILSEAGSYDLLMVGLRSDHPQRKLSGIANRILNFHETSTIFVQ